MSVAKYPTTIILGGIAFIHDLMPSCYVPICLGPSGAGKSSLFDVLARRIGSSGRLEGQMYVNGATVSDKDFMR